jgi:glutamate carboxypeptidase
MFQSHLNAIDAERDAMISRLIGWSQINSGTANFRGLASMLAALESVFAELGGSARRAVLPPATHIDSGGAPVEQPLGEALTISKHPEAPLRVLLCIHYDTVFAPENAFQQPRMEGDDKLIGPGVVDAKGGIAVLFTALQALERSPWAERIGWEVILNPDEEIGSPGSAGLLAQAAQRNRIGLVFEPALPDGALVDSRKGSGAFTFVVRGRSAHAGRDFSTGRNAILAAADLLLALETAARQHPEIIVNPGQIEGGGAVNIVPDLAIARVNVRAETPAHQRVIEELIRHAADHARHRSGITVEVHGNFASPPRLLDPRSKKLLDEILICGRELGMNLAHRPSGGTCDGNKLAAAGLAVIDSLGPVGGELHSDREYVVLSSLTQRAKLTALLLMKLAAGEIRAGDW